MYVYYSGKETIIHPTDSKCRIEYSYEYIKTQTIDVMIYHIFKLTKTTVREGTQYVAQNGMAEKTNIEKIISSEKVMVALDNQETDSLYGSVNGFYETYVSGKHVIQPNALKNILCIDEEDDDVYNEGTT